MVFFGFIWVCSSCSDYRDDDDDARPRVVSARDGPQTLPHGQMGPVRVK
jgi:hypothetical protein